jgi:hypothetical protein
VAIRETRELVLIASPNGRASDVAIPFQIDEKRLIVKTRHDRFDVVSIEGFDVPLDEFLYHQSDHGLPRLHS